MKDNCRSTLFFFLIMAGMFGMPSRAAAQSGASAAVSNDDLALVRNQPFSSPDEFAHYHGAGNSDKAIQNKHHNIIAEYNPVSLVLRGAMLGYQKLVSEQLGRDCPYAISCSNFTKLAIAEYGAFKGVFIGADRLLRCNRIGIMDVSPINIDRTTGRLIDSPNMYR